MRRLGVPMLPAPVRWLLVGVVAAINFVYSILIAPRAPPEPGPFWDKQLHFAAYAALATAVAYATARSDLASRNRIFAIIGGALVYGIAIELLQAPLPNRYFSAADIAANAVGALLGLVYLVIEPRVQYMPLGGRSR